MDIGTRVWTGPSPCESPRLVPLYQHPTPIPPTHLKPLPSAHMPASLDTHVIPWAARDGRKQPGIGFQRTSPASHQLSALGQMVWPGEAGHLSKGYHRNKPMRWPGLFSEKSRG